MLLRVHRGFGSRYSSQIIAPGQKVSMGKYCRGRNRIGLQRRLRIGKYTVAFTQADARLMFVATA